MFFTVKRENHPGWLALSMAGGFLLGWTAQRYSPELKMAICTCDENKQ